MTYEIIQGLINDELAKALPKLRNPDVDLIPIIVEAMMAVAAQAVNETLRKSVEEIGRSARPLLGMVRDGAVKGYLEASQEIAEILNQQYLKVDHHQRPVLPQVELPRRA